MWDRWSTKGDIPQVRVSYFQGWSFWKAPISAFHNMESIWTVVLSLTDSSDCITETVAPTVRSSRCWEDVLLIFISPGYMPWHTAACNQCLWQGWWMNDEMNKDSGIESSMQPNHTITAVMKSECEHGYLITVGFLTVWPESNRQLSAQGRSAAWDSRSSGLKRHYFLSFLMRWPVITLFLQDTGIRRCHSELFLLLTGLPLWSIYTVTASQLGVLPSASSTLARNGVSSRLGLQDIFQPIF